LRFISKRLRFVAFITTCLLFLQTNKSYAEFSGNFQNFIYLKPNSSDIKNVGSRLKLNYNYSYSKVSTFETRLAFNANYEENASESENARESNFTIYPIELYYKYSSYDTDIRVGQHYIFWGKSNWLSPLDVLTSWDYSNITGHTDDYRIAPNSLHLTNYFKNKFSLDAVWVPIFTPNTSKSLTGNNFNNIPITSYSINKPDLKLNNGEFALKLAQVISYWAFDWSVIAYRGFNKSPSYVVTPIFNNQPPPPSELHFSAYYNEKKLLGMDFAKAINSFVIKGEFAWIFGNNSNQNLDDNSNFDSILTLDYSFDENTNFAFQFYYHYISGYNSSIQQSYLIREYGFIPNFVQTQDSTKLGFYFQAKFLSDWGVQITPIYSTSYKDYFLIGYFWWDIVDGGRLTFGNITFDGKSPYTPFSRQNDNSMKFIEFSFSF